MGTGFSCVQPIAGVIRVRVDCPDFDLDRDRHHQVANQYLEATSGVTQVKHVRSGEPPDPGDEVIATAAPTILGWLASRHAMGMGKGTYPLESVASCEGGVGGTSSSISVTVSN
jgi:hypothetical protein